MNSDFICSISDGFNIPEFEQVFSFIKKFNFETAKQRIVLGHRFALFHIQKATPEGVALNVVIVGVEGALMNLAYFCPRSPSFFTAACAAASLAMGTRNGEQET